MLIRSDLTHSLSTQEALGAMLLSRVVGPLLRRMEILDHGSTTDTGKFC